jgi:hypothetical protein
VRRGHHLIGRADEAIGVSTLRHTGELGTTLAVTSNRRTLMETSSSSERSVLTRATRRNIPEGGILRKNLCLHYSVQAGYATCIRLPKCVSSGLRRRASEADHTSTPPYVFTPWTVDPLVGYVSNWSGLFGQHWNCLTVAMTVSDSLHEHDPESRDRIPFAAVTTDARTVITQSSQVVR